MPTSTVADFGTNEVYLNPDSIANVLSLYLLGKKHHITYDSQDCGSVFKAHTSIGVLEFKRTQNGLHALNLPSTPAAAHMLVTPPQPSDEHLHVNTVRENFEGFTHCQVQRATDACHLMQMVASPTEHNFQSMVHLILLKDYPVTHDNVTNAHKIFGPDLANIKGKTVRKKPEWVDTDYVEIPKSLLSNNINVALVADIFFVKIVPFQVLALCNINLITIDHAPCQSASKLGHLLQRIVQVYAQAGFRVQTILMDNKFAKVSDHIPNASMTTPAASGHIAEIECRIHVIKEHTHGILCNLPYPNLPQQILICLLHFIVMWLNNFPTSICVSLQWSPREHIFVTTSISKNIARHQLVPILRCMKKMILPTVWTRVVPLPSAVVPKATSRAPTIFSVLSPGNSSNVAASLNSRSPNWSLIKQYTLPRPHPHCKNLTLFLKIATIALMIGLKTTIFRDQIQLLWLPILISLPKCRECNLIASIALLLKPHLHPIMMLTGNNLLTMPSLTLILITPTSYPLHLRS
jgi:hypothetical protein